MTTKVMIYIYDHSEHYAEIKFGIVGHDGMSTERFDAEADNMLVTLFNDEADKWLLNDSWEDESSAEEYDDYGKVSL